MKKATLIAIVVTLSTVMFAGVNVTWGNTYSDNAGSLGSEAVFGVWFDVNDATSVGWENGLKIGIFPPWIIYVCFIITIDLHKGVISKVLIKKFATAFLAFIAALF